MSGEAMLFPDTWEEFVKEYGYTDKSRERFVGYVEVIPVMRVNQWLDHVNAMNKAREKEYERSDYPESTGR